MSDISSRQKGFTMVEALLVILILAVIGFGGYYVLNNQNKTNLISFQPSSTEPNTVTIMSNIRQDLASMFTLQNGQDNVTSYPPNSSTLILSTYPGGPASGAPGYNFYFEPTQGSILQITAYQTSASSQPDNAVMASIQSIILATFKRLDLVAIANPVQAEYAANYQNATAVCFYYYQSEPYNNPITLTCADKSVYPTDAAVINPLAAAYYKANPISSGGIQTFGMPTIKVSQTPGYKFATMPVGQAQSVYYQKGGTWYFYGAGMAGPYCNFTTNTQSSLNNNDARLALLGTPCQNNDGSWSTVQ